QTSRKVRYATPSPLQTIALRALSAAARKSPRSAGASEPQNLEINCSVSMSSDRDVAMTALPWNCGAVESMTCAVDELSASVVLRLRGAFVISIPQLLR